MEGEASSLLDPLIAQVRSFLSAGRRDQAKALLKGAGSFLEGEGQDRHEALAELAIAADEPEQAAYILGGVSAGRKGHATLLRRALYETAAALREGRAPLDASSPLIRRLGRLPDYPAAEIRNAGREIAALFDPYDGPGLAIARPEIDLAHVYTISMMPRSGSNFLIKCLTETGVMGQPGEYLHRNEPTAMPLIASRFGTPTLDSFMAEVMGRTRGTSGVFGIKLHINMLLPLLVEGTFERTLASGKFVYTTREDVLMQAISFVRAQQTGVWTARNEPAGTPQFDFDAIFTVIRSLTRMMDQWETFFALRKIAPLRVTYEEIDRDTDGVVSRIADHLGVGLTTPTRFRDRRDSVQRDSLSQVWRERFLESQRGRQI